MEILELINSGSQRLKNNNINTYRLDSEILLANIFNKKREEILTNLNKKVSIKIIRERSPLQETFFINYFLKILLF